MGACHGDTRHLLDQGNGIDLWWCAALAGTGDGIDSWGLAMGTCNSGWIGVMGLIHGGVPWGRAARAGSGRLH